MLLFPMRRFFYPVAPVLESFFFTQMENKTLIYNGASFFMIPHNNNYAYVMPGGKTFNITKILRAAFAPIFLCQKSTNLKCKYLKVTGKTFEQKSIA